MGLDKFTDLLDEMSVQLSMKLIPDENNSCLLSLENGLNVQIELDADEERVLIGSELGGLPPGKFRENVLREGLIANSRLYPRFGNLSFSRKRNTLVIFEMLNLQFFTTEIIVNILTALIDQACQWKNALANALTAPPGLLKPKAGEGKMFGLTP